MSQLNLLHRKMKKQQKPGSSEETVQVVVPNSRKYAPEKIWELFCYSPEKYSLPHVSFFCCATKRTSPFFLYIAHKKTLLMIKYELSTSCRYISKRDLDLDK